MILLIDNYDSFSYNVYQLIGSIEPDIKVIRNDEITVEEIEALKPSHIVLSPGPGRPDKAGICEEVIRCFADKIPVLGICLGHQAVCEVFGGEITYAKELMHGKRSRISLDTDSKLFQGMKKEIPAARYHSLAVNPETLPDTLRVTAKTEEGEIMAVEHIRYPVYGLQFHPESVLTESGSNIIYNFLTNGLSEKQEAKGEKVLASPVNGENKNEQSGQKEQEEKEFMIQEAIVKLSKKEDIGYEMSRKVMNEIMSGTASEVQKSAYLTALSLKGETIEEITGSAEEMRNHGIKLKTGLEVLEIVGTGGDRSNSFNISTTASLISSAAGVPIAKHGNRAASSRSGAADCLEALGVNIMLTPEQNQKVLEEIGICFLFAQKYHTAMKYVAPIRKELGIRTVFNILGPLANPAGASLQVMGVYDEAMLEPMARVLTNLGVKRGMVVFGQDGLDEISISAPTSICEISDGKYSRYTIIPEQFGMKRCGKEELVGGTPQENAEITRNILNGEKGPKRDAAVLNAAAALYVAGRTPDIQEGVRLAEHIIDSGKAMEHLEKFIKLTGEIAAL